MFTAFAIKWYCIYARYWDTLIPYHTCPKLWTSSFHYFSCARSEDSYKPAHSRNLIRIFIRDTHYKNTPIQIYWKFHYQKTESFLIKNLIFLHISAQNIDCGYSLEPPRWGGSNEYPQSMLLSRNKNNAYPCKSQFYYIKVQFKGSKLYR